MKHLWSRTLAGDALATYPARNRFGNIVHVKSGHPESKESCKRFGVCWFLFV